MERVHKLESAGIFVGLLMHLKGSLELLWMASKSSLVKSSLAKVATLES